MKSVIIYCYFKSPSSDLNLSFFVKKELLNVNFYRQNNFDLQTMSDEELIIHYNNHGKNEGRLPNNNKHNSADVDYIIVINGHECNENIHFPNLDNLTIIKRDNIGFDFGGYNSALEYIEKNNKIYDHYFFLNSGVIGPILPHYFTDYHWSNIFIKKINEKVKLVGTTIVCLPSYDSGGYGPKVESFFFMTDQIGLKLFTDEKTIFCNHKTHRDCVINGEYGTSNCIFKHNYSIDCMLRKYQNIDWTDKKNYNLNNNIHPSRKNSFYGNSINPYEVIFHKWVWKMNTTVNEETVNEETVNEEIIKQYVDNNT
jgi:hypothetical protein